MVKQIVLLAGGKGTRMRELTETIPKPMVTILNKPFNAIERAPSEATELQTILIKLP